MNSPTDPFIQLERTLAATLDAAAKQVAAWQKVHFYTQNAYDLTKHFNIERTAVPPSGGFENYSTEFSQISGAHLMKLADNINYSGGPGEVSATTSLLLSALQSNIASYVQGQPGIEILLPKTKSFLVSQSVPLEDRATQLQLRLKLISDHYATMMEGVKEDLLNSTNPLSLSNAAKNLREILTAFVHLVSPDAAVLNWTALETDNGRPTRRTRLRYYVFMSLDPNLWPSKWRDSVDDTISDLLQSFSQLSKFTHVNEKTGLNLQLARVELEKFCDRLIGYLDANAGKNEVFQEGLVESVRVLLQIEAENSLHGELEAEVSHVYEPTVNDVEIEIGKVDDEFVHFDGSFTIHATFQIGSDGDVRRGDGLEWEDTRTAHFCGFVNKLDLSDISISEVSLDQKDYNGEESESLETEIDGGWEDEADH